MQGRRAFAASLGTMGWAAGETSMKGREQVDLFYALQSSISIFWLVLIFWLWTRRD